MQIRLYEEIPTLQLHPRCTNAQNCLGPTLGSRAVVRNFNPRVPHIKGLKILRVPGNCSLENSRVPLHRSSKSYGCQAPVAPVLTTPLGR